MKQFLVFIFLLSINASTFAMEKEQKRALKIAKQKEAKRLELVKKMEEKRVEVQARILMKVEQRRAALQQQAELEESEK